jgi:2-oxo-4-hydroxy-4-carboxy-5-ureidoimidazoline decarboxylase
MSIAEFDKLNLEEKREYLLQCCGSENWVNKMVSVFPVEDLVELLEAAETNWYQCSEADWRKAFEHHPKIGNINSLKEKFASTKDWASKEQSGVDEASENIITQLAEGNKKYEQKFGFIFIVCATGKLADEMLNILHRRINNTPEEEIKIAAEEQNKITKLRLEKLFN